MMSLSDHHVIESVSCFFPDTRQTIPSEFIRKNMMREVIYDVLCGSCGRQFIQSIINISQADAIYEANSWIKENFRDSFAVEHLAQQRNMSVSQFHQKFKNAVGMGPLQCQKRLRLTEARRLMLDDRKNVTEAELEVGYESLSQFARDYRKIFGSAPKEDIQRALPLWQSRQMIPKLHWWPADIRCLQTAGSPAVSESAAEPRNRTARLLSM